MSVEFYGADDLKLSTLLFSLNDQEFEFLEPVLVNFKKLTGLIIDQYGTTRVAFDHVNLLNRLIDENAQNNLKIADKLNSIKLKLGTVRSDIIAVGD